MRLRGIIGTLCAVLCSVGTASGYRVFYGSMHSHTSYSDGIGTPAEAYAYARDVANIDVLAVTDHSGMLTAAEWNDELTQAGQFTEAGVFVGLAAQEFGNLNDFGHIGIFDSIYRDQNSTDNLTATYQFMKDLGAVGNFNHPVYGTNFEDLAFYPDYVNQMIGIEVRNGFRSDNYEPQYIEALQHGWHVAPMANQDNHEGRWGDQGNPAQGGAVYLEGILADTLTKQSILGALRARRFYAMEARPASDRVELDFRANGSPMGSSIVSSAHLALTGTAHAVNGVSLFNWVDLFEDGVLVDNRFVIGNTIEWQFDRALQTGEQHFYFVRTHQVDGDHAWSAPIWVTGQVNPSEAADATDDGRFVLFSAFPNPGAGPFAVAFRVPSNRGPARIELTVHDLGGRKVAGMAPASFPPGVHGWTWSPKRSAGGPAAGIYFCRMIADGACVATRKVVLTP